MFKREQKVVCVANFTHDIDGNYIADKYKMPKKDFVYEIDGVISADGSVYLYIKGFNECNPDRIHFESSGFKPYIDPQKEMNKAKEEILNRELILN